MSSSGANPFTCEALVDSARCGRDASYVHKSASSPAMLFCDGCAAELKASSRGMRKVPVIEFSLLELLPAREGLLGALREANEQIAKGQQAFSMLEDAFLQIRAACWWVAGALAISIGMSIWGWLR